MPEKSHARKRARTMQELAAVAGCSVMSVSLALRDSPRVSVKRRDEIKALAVKFGYRPNPLVSAFAASRRRKNPAFQATIAFLHHFEDDDHWHQKFPAYAELERGVYERAAELGYQVETFWARKPGITDVRWQKILETRGIQGVILPPLVADGSSVSHLDWRGFSVIAIGYSVREPDFHRVSHDYFHGMMEALRNARRLNCRRIGFFIHREVNRSVFNLWLAAYLAEQQATPGLPVIPALLLDRGSEGKIRKWATTNRLDAVIGVDTQTLEDRGISLPKRVRLYALNADDYPNATPGISRNFFQLGRLAFDRLVALLHANERGVPELSTTTLVEGSWTEPDHEA